MHELSWGRIFELETLKSECQVDSLLQMGIANFGRPFDGFKFRRYGSRVSVKGCSVLPSSCLGETPFVAQVGDRRSRDC
jgi:hypothetical protein